MSDADKPLNKKDQKRLDEKRGEGTGKDYVPFIKAGEFSSSGESVRVLRPVCEIERLAGLSRARCRKPAREILRLDIPAWQRAAALS